jgi:hypothetical protein
MLVVAKVWEIPVRGTHYLFYDVEYLNAGGVSVRGVEYLFVRPAFPDGQPGSIKGSPPKTRLLLQHNLYASYCLCTEVVLGGYRRNGLVC